MALFHDLFQYRYSADADFAVFSAQQAYKYRIVLSDHDIAHEFHTGQTNCLPLSLRQSSNQNAFYNLQLQKPKITCVQDRDYLNRNLKFGSMYWHLNADLNNVDDRPRLPTGEKPKLALELAELYLKQRLYFQQQWLHLQHE